jgi:hypothetical protein
MMALASFQMDALAQLLVTIILPLFVMMEAVLYQMDALILRLAITIRRRVVTTGAVSFLLVV